MSAIAKQVLMDSILGKAWLIAFVATMGLCTFTAYSGAKPPPPPPDDLREKHNWKPSSAKQHNYYNLGPTGMMGIFKGPTSLTGQIFVASVDKDSPASGKIVPGDVLLGVNGQPFEKGDNLIVKIGNAINEAEKNENKGKITFTVWHDENWSKRKGEVNITTISVSDILKDVDEADDGLGDWRTEEQQQQAESNEYLETYEKFPIIATSKEVTLTLNMMGSFTATAPFDCSKTEKILESAWPHIESAAQGRKGLSGWRSGTIGLALLASGKPEHVELVKKMLHKNNKLMAGEPVGRGGWRWGYGAWYGGYYLTFLGEYYLRTGDEAILPALRQWALGVAKIQAYGGTWGHSGHSRASNFGNLHGPATGYGAMNQAAGPCFYGLTLAQKSGINEPIVDEAIRRSVKYYSTYVDKGGVPYGFHPPVLYEDSNGKNGPPALAMRMVGETYKAKYYSLCGAVSSGWGYRGGHGDGTFGNYWPQLASSLAGKEAVAFWMSRMHPYYTMLRRHDGSFVSVRFGSAGGLGGQFHQTSMYMLHYSIPRAKLYMTGRDVTPEYRATKRDLMHLRNRSGSVDWSTFSTDEIISNLDTFSPEQRRSTKKGYPRELLTRYEAGEKEMVPKLVKMLNHSDPRGREAGFYMLSALGIDVAKSIQDRAIEALNDPVEIVRMAAVATIRKANTTPLPEGVKKNRRAMDTVDLDDVANPLFAAALKRFENDTHDTYNTPYMLQQLMINSNNAFAKAPFGQGYDTEKVALVLESFLTQDPRSGIMNGPSNFWDRDTVVRMAGPIVFVAETYPMNGIMFGGSACSGGQSLLIRHKFIEGIEGGAMESNKISRVRREWRPRLQPTGLGWYSPGNLKKFKGMGKTTLPWLYKVLVERPNISQRYMVGRQKVNMRLTDAIHLIEANQTPDGWASLRDEAMKAYLNEVDAKGNKAAQVAFCRATLDPTRKTYFRQLAAMDRLVELLGQDAAKDLTPYLSHEHWRFQDHSKALMMKLKGDSVSEILVALSDSDDDAVASGALSMLGARGDKDGVKAGLKHIASHRSGRVRGAAAQAIYGGSKGDKLPQVLEFITQAKADEERDGYEVALLLLKSDTEKATAVAAGIKKTVPKCPIPVRNSLYYVLGQLGGSANLNYVRNRVSTEDLNEFKGVVDAISRSPDVSATKVLLDILKEHEGTLRALDVSKASVKRLINGAETIGKVPDSANLDFAESHLKVVRNLDVIEYLGNINGGRCLQLLYHYMKLGPAEVTEKALRSIIRSADMLSKDLPLASRKAAAEVLGGVMEYINVVQTRGGTDNVSFADAGRYAEYKVLADKAGAVLKQIYSPEEDAIDADDGGIDVDELDL